MKQDNTTIIQGLYDAVNQKNYEYISQLGHLSSEWRDVPFDYTTTGKAWINLTVAPIAAGELVD